MIFFICNVGSFALVYGSNVHLARYPIRFITGTTTVSSRNWTFVCYYANLPTNQGRTTVLVFPNEWLWCKVFELASEPL